MDATAAAKRWAREWQAAWTAHDADRVARLYAENAVLQLHPFRDSYRGTEGAREYSAWAFASEEAPPEVTFREPVVFRNRAACEYWAIVTVEGAIETIAGISLLDFNDDGLVVQQRDYWHSQPGRNEPPAGWDR